MITIFADRFLLQSEENVDLQTRSAAAVSAFITFCSKVPTLTQPPEKIVKNLCTFLCQDIDQTPTFAFNKHIEAGILSSKSIKEIENSGSSKPIPKGQPEPTSEEAAKSRISRRGAELAFTQLSVRFGDRLFDLIPKMWELMAGGLLTTYAKEDLREGDKLMERQYGQDVIDSLSVLRVTSSTLHHGLWDRLVMLLPNLTFALRSRFAIIRQCSAKSFARICGVIITQAMRHVIEEVVPLLGDSLSLSNRQGAVELIYRERI